MGRYTILDSGTASIFIGSDRKCAEEFQQALGMEGLEKRKRIADLVAYGCGFLADGPVHVAVARRDSNYMIVTPAEGKHQGQSGWVPAAWVK